MNFREIWIANELNHQRKRKNALVEAYNNLKDKENDYAKAIWKMYCMRCAIIDLIVSDNFPLAPKEEKSYGNNL